jgi:hypothetical protein
MTDDEEEAANEEWLEEEWQPSQQQFLLQFLHGPDQQLPN